MCKSEPETSGASIIKMQKKRHLKCLVFSRFFAIFLNMLAQLTHFVRRAELLGLFRKNCAKTIHEPSSSGYCGILMWLLDTMVMGYASKYFACSAVDMLLIRQQG
jgi:hypothetical protein